MVLSEMYFPSLRRSVVELYHNQNGEFYANYSSNYGIVAQDCMHRCVYCDATEKECGGEPFSLDHFRPRSVFGDRFEGVLVIHPYNLHLSCQKCNVLKGKDWQGCKETIDGPTYLAGKGYIDRFAKDISDFLIVDEDGCLIPSQSNQDASSPARYLIKRLHLNRPNRVYLRKKRALDVMVKNIEDLFARLTIDILNRHTNGLLNSDEGMTLIKEIQNLKTRFIEVQSL